MVLSSTLDLIQERLVMIQLARRYLVIYRWLVVIFGLSVSLQARGSDLSCSDIQPIVEHGFLMYHVIYNNQTPNLEQRTVTQYIKRLDSSKRYLLQSDVDQIHKLMKGVFGKIKK